MLKSKAVVYGSEGNSKAQTGQYYDAIALFSKAIDLYPLDYRFFLNRAFCYEKTELYHLALADSEEAILLNPQIEKCYFRKARSLFGLREYLRAEEVYRRVLKMNPHSIETRDDLVRMRCSALIDMGFDKQTSISAANSYDTIHEAINELLAQKESKNNDFNNKETKPDFDNKPLNCNLNEKVRDSCNLINGNTQVSKNESEFFNNNNNYIKNNDQYDRHSVEAGDRYADKARSWAQLVQKNPQPVSKSEPLLKPTNIWSYNGLRVENVNCDNKKSLMKRFSVFGKVKAIEPVRNSKTSVWVYYDNSVSPVQAIAQMQGSIHLDISYYNKGHALPIRMFFAPTNDQTELKFCRPKQPQDNKGECYYWRTTSCSLADKCTLLHIPINKHIDAQVWMKSRDGKQI